MNIGKGLPINPCIYHRRIGRKNELNFAIAITPIMTKNFDATGSNTGVTVECDHYSLCCNHCERSRAMSCEKGETPSWLVKL